ncbi:uncharacterized protein LOC123621894 isoform X2 [Lemur catta]|uniref:uncharacterized protein LOC123621894 isoform X2 n=1 Tax=Lemur catta TaxID=9447 RepID=UPI001E267C7D|nr:uncharacterized protein LOC123621894 isoform X2 [Lemur catta]
MMSVAATPLLELQPNNAQAVPSSCPPNVSASPVKSAETSPAEGLCAVPFAPTFSPSTPRNLATASCISPTTPTLLRPYLPTQPNPTQSLKQQSVAAGNPALERPPVAKIGTSFVCFVTHRSAARPWCLDQQRLLRRKLQLTRMESDLGSCNLSPSFPF